MNDDKKDDDHEITSSHDARGASSHLAVLQADVGINKLDESKGPHSTALALVADRIDTACRAPILGRGKVAEGLLARMEDTGAWSTRR